MNKDKTKLSIFVSYSSTNQSYLDDLISIFTRHYDNSVEILYDLHVRNGHDGFVENIVKMGEDADCFLLLLSSGFFNSPFIQEKEVEGFTFDADNLWGIIEKAQLNKPVFSLIVEDFKEEDWKEKQPYKHIWSTNNIRYIEDETKEKYKYAKPLSSKEEFIKSLIFFVNDVYGFSIKPKSEYSVEDYITEINEGRFVPIIGPKCFGQQQDWQPFFPHLKGRRDELFNKADIQKSAKSFLNAVISSHVPDLGKISGQSVNTDEYLNLLASVAEAGAAISNILGNALIECKNIVNTRHLHVKVDGSAKHNTDSNVEQLLVSLEMGAKKAILIKEKHNDCMLSTQNVCMGAQGIAEKLTHLHQTISKEPYTLTKSLLDWFSDLLWHILSYDIPIYPTTGVLGLQMSICRQANCFARIPLGTAGVISSQCALILDDTPSIPCYRFFGRYLKQKAKSALPESSSFYLSTTTLLNRFFKVNPDYQPQSKKGKPSPSAIDAADEDITAEGQTLRIPIAISVNIDGELEHSLKLAGAFSVIFPVRPIDKKRTSWMLQVLNKDKDETNYLLRSDNSFNEIKDKINGPLIVQLRGCFSHQDVTNGGGRIMSLPEESNAQIKIEDIYYNHVFLSSIDYARWITSKDGMPVFLQEILKDPDRILCFCGYPLDGQDELLSILKQACIADEGKDDVQINRKLSIGCDRRDGLGSTFLHELNLEPLKTNLTTFSEELHKIFSKSEKTKTGVPCV